MKCRSCGAEIADKAIVCYRCGTPTALPVAPPQAARRGIPWGIGALVAVVATMAAAVTWPADRLAEAIIGGTVAVALAAMAARRRT